MLDKCFYEIFLRKPTGLSTREACGDSCLVVFFGGGLPSDNLLQVPCSQWLIQIKCLPAARGLIRLVNWIWAYLDTF